MKKLMFALLALGLPALLWFSIAANASAARPAPFIGAWQAIDVDGSNMKLTITPDHDAYRIHTRDDAASSCGKTPNGEIRYAWLAQGTLTADGNVLQGSYTGWCLSHPPTFWGTYPALYYTYDPDTDTLIDTAYPRFTITWYRIKVK